MNLNVTKGFLALTLTGFIWVRYSLVITPVNYSLAAVRHSQLFSTFLPNALFQSGQFLRWPFWTHATWTHSTVRQLSPFSRPYSTDRCIQLPVHPSRSSEVLLMGGRVDALSINRNDNNTASRFENIIYNVNQLLHMCELSRMRAPCLALGL